MRQHVQAGADRRGSPGRTLVEERTRLGKAQDLAARQPDRQLLGNVLLVLSLLWESGEVLTAKRLAARYNGRAR